MIGRFDFYTLNIRFREHCHFAEIIAPAGFDLRMDANTTMHEWSNQLRNGTFIIQKCRRPWNGASEQHGKYGSRQSQVWRYDSLNEGTQK